MFDKIFTFDYNKLNINKYKKNTNIILSIISFLCIIVLFPYINSIIIKIAESFISISSLNTTWSIVILSYALSGLITSITILYYINLKNYNIKFHFSIYSLFILSILSFIVYITYNFGTNWLNSDHSAELILGKLLSEENAILSSNWYYTTELRIFHQTLFLIPLFKIFNNWKLIRTITCFLNNIFLLCSYYFMAKQINISKKSLMITSLFLIIPTNIIYFDIVTFGGYYIFFLSIYFIFIGLFLLIIKNKPSSEKNKFHIIILFLIAMLMGICGVRSIMDLTLPFFITCMFIMSYKDNKTHKYLTVSLLCLLFSILGFLINNILYFKYRYASDLKVILDDPFNTIFQKLGNIIWFFPLYMGYEGNSFFFTPNGIFSILSLFLCVSIIMISFRLLRKQKSGVFCFPQPHLFIILFFFVTLVYHLIFYLIINPKYMVLRYFIPVFIFFIPVLGILFEDIKQGTKPWLKSIFILTAVITILGNGGLKFHKLLSKPDENASRKGYINYLEENKLFFGFSTFWNSCVTTELSNGRIVVGGIDLGTNLKFEHDKWVTEKKFENPLFFDKDTFVLFTDSEWNDFKKLDRLKNKSPVYKDEEFVILTYPSTIILHEELFF